MSQQQQMVQVSAQEIERARQDLADLDARARARGLSAQEYTAAANLRETLGRLPAAQAAAPPTITPARNYGEALIADTLAMRAEAEKANPHAFGLGGRRPG